MLNITKGNLLEANTEALVNTVNCIGFMGKGIALQFKQAFPDNFKAYANACKAKKVQPGKNVHLQSRFINKSEIYHKFPDKTSLER